MADFAFNLLTHSPERLNVISTRLGAGNTPNDRWDDAEIGKAVKIGPNATHVHCEQDDEIQAIVDNVDSGGTNGGYSFGGVARGNRGFRAKAVIGPNQGATPAALDDLVVADAQYPKGTKGGARVKTGAPTRDVWRIIALRGDGTPGTEVIIELC